MLYWLISFLNFLLSENIVAQYSCQDFFWTSQVTYKKPKNQSPSNVHLFVRRAMQWHLGYNQKF